MAVSTTTNAIRYTGNGTSDPYTIPFPFLDTTHIKAAVETLTLAGLGYPRAALVEEFTDYQFPFEKDSGADLLAAGDVIRVKRTDDSYSADFTVAAVSELIDSAYYIVTINSALGVTITGGDLASGDEDEIYLVEGDLLSDSEYTVTRLEDGSGGSLVTTEDVSVDSSINIWRDVPLTQPTVFQPAGPFPAKGNETALDRLLMQLQQINRRLNAIEGVGEDYITPPGGNPTETREVLTWANSGARGASTPHRTGQLGVQVDTKDVYVALSTDTGDWGRLGEFQKEWQIVENGVEVPATVTNQFVARLAQEGTVVKSLYVFTNDVGEGDVVVTVKAGGSNLAILTLVADTTEIFGESLLDTVWPRDTEITVSITNANPGSGSVEGLGLVLLCRYF